MEFLVAIVNQNLLVKLRTPLDPRHSRLGSSQPKALALPWLVTASSSTSLIAYSISVFLVILPLLCTWLWGCLLNCGSGAFLACCSSEAARSPHSTTLYICHSTILSHCCPGSSVQQPNPIVQFKATATPASPKLSPPQPTPVTLDSAAPIDVHAHTAD